MLTAITIEDKQTAPKKRKEKKEKSVVPTSTNAVSKTLVNCKGFFPCSFASCKFELPVCRMLNHVRSNHSQYFDEGSLGSDGTFKITYSVASWHSARVYKWQRALFVSGIGLVYLTYIVIRSIKHTKIITGQFF